MPRIPTAVIPRTVFAGIHHSKSRIDVSQALFDSATMDSVAILQKFESNRNGLSEAAATERLVKFGPNVFAKDQRVGNDYTIHPPLCKSSLFDREFGLLD